LSPCLINFYRPANIEKPAVALKEHLLSFRFEPLTKDPQPRTCDQSGLSLLNMNMSINFKRLTSDHTHLYQKSMNFKTIYNISHILFHVFFTIYHRTPHNSTRKINFTTRVDLSQQQCRIVAFKIYK